MGDGYGSEYICGLSLSHALLGVPERLASNCFQGSVRSLSFQQVLGLLWTANQGRLREGVERSLGWRHTSALISGLAERPTGEQHCHGNS